jgi:hypothetical protein
MLGVVGLGQTAKAIFAGTNGMNSPAGVDPRRYHESVQEARTASASRPPVCLYLEVTNRCNLLCTTCPVGGWLLRMVYGARFSDLSPFRAIRWDALSQLGMRDTSYGWNLEMLMRVAAAGLPAVEIPVGQRRRIGGVSKVSGNLAASIKAAAVLAITFVRLALSLRRERRREA